MRLVGYNALMTYSAGTVTIVRSAHFWRGVSTFGVIES